MQISQQNHDKMLGCGTVVQKFIFSLIEFNTKLYVTKWNTSEKPFVVLISVQSFISLRLIVSKVGINFYSFNSFIQSFILNELSVMIIKNRTVNCRLQRLKLLSQKRCIIAGTIFNEKDSILFRCVSRWYWLYHNVYCLLNTF